MPTFDAIHLELRDFFAKLSFDEIRELATAIATTGRKPELDATLRESAAVIPTIRRLADELNDRQAAGDLEQTRVLQGQLILLMAIFRIAEDKGYRWLPPGSPPPATQPPHAPTEPPPSNP